MCIRKEKEICFHHWVHNAGKQCEWDCWDFKDSLHKTRPEDYRKDSIRMCYFYICTMCGEEFWSQRKEFDIPHYRVKEVKRQKCRRKERR